MNPRPRLRGLRFGTAMLAVLIGLSALLAGCDVLAGKGSRLLLEVRSEPGEGLAYDPPTVVSPAGTPVALTFVNVSTLEHNLVFLDPLSERTRAIVLPGEWDRLEFVTPAPGSYEFVCTIHEEMRGSLVVH